MSDLDTVFLEYLMDALLVHRTKGPGCHFESDGPVQFGYEDLFGHEVRALNAFGLALRVGNVVSRHAALARHLTNSSHRWILR